MKELLLKNIEKVVLAALLVILAGCAVYLILTIENKVINVIKDPNAGAIFKVTEYVPKEIKVASLNLAKTQPFDSQGYIYCRKVDCKYIILATMQKCPVCSTPTKPVTEILSAGQDKDLDGITDKDELKYGLNPDDASDATLDKDGDGFSNIDELKLKFDLGDKLSHPSVINRTKLSPRISEKEYYPIILANLVLNDPKDKTKWDINGDIFVKNRKKGFFNRINETIPEIGYTITDVGVEEDGKQFIIIVKEGEQPAKIFASKNPAVKRELIVVLNELTNEIVKFEEGKEFKLKDLNGTEEKYKAEKVVNNELIVIDYQINEKVKLGFNSTLPKPGTPVENPTIPPVETPVNFPRQ